jgi:hypothetical protein
MRWDKNEEIHVMTNDFTSIKVIYGVSWREFEMFGNLI